MNYSETKRMQNLIRVANEIAGKGAGKDGENGEPIGDDIEAINQTQPETEETLQVVEDIATKILERLINIQESVSFEMSDDEVDMAIDSIINQIMYEQMDPRFGKPAVDDFLRRKLRDPERTKSYSPDEVEAHASESVPRSQGGTGRSPGSDYFGERQKRLIDRKEMEKDRPVIRR